MSNKCCSGDGEGRKDKGGGGGSRSKTRCIWRVVCDKVVCERWCVTKKDGVCVTKLCVCVYVKDGVCAPRSVTTPPPGSPKQPPPTPPYRDGLTFFQPRNATRETVEALPSVWMSVAEERQHWRLVTGQTHLCIQVNLPLTFLNVNVR